jgi:glycosyltransferase involved in cell wall biosynthesis
MPDKSNRPLVSVIIPTYKRPALLGRAVRSVLTQTYDPVEIIVVDDNPEGTPSRRETEAVMREFMEERRVRYVKHAVNQGGSAARNTGIQLARGEFISFLDDDDEYLPTKIERQYERFVTSEIPNLGIVFCGINIMDQNGRFLRYVLNKVRGNAFAYHLTRNLATCQTLFIPTAVLKQVNGFRVLRCAQDYDLVLRILAAGYQVDYVNELLISVYFHDGERISTNDDKIAGKHEMYKIKSGYFHLLSKKKIRQVKYAYYILLFRHHLLKKKRRQAVYYFLLALKTDLFDTRNLTEGIALFLPYSLLVKAKALFHKINRTFEDFSE